jgi:hypothetical protein
MRSAPYTAQSRWGLWSSNRLKPAFGGEGDRASGLVSFSGGGSVELCAGDAASGESRTLDIESAGYFDADWPDAIALSILMQ